MIVDHKHNIIEITDLSFSYDKAPILKNVNLNIHVGDYLVITGENGSGKSTLLKLILGLLPIQKGQIKLFGTPLAEFKDWSRIAYVPQKVTNFDHNFPVTVEEVVLMGRYGRIGLFKNPTESDRIKAAEALNQVQMGQFAKQQISALSGGQQQRVFIARALASDPEIVFLDEPTTGIDKKSRREFYDFLQKMNQDLNLTVVLVSHEVNQIAANVMHVACLDQTIVYHQQPEKDHGGH
ncbi:ABC transporter ATP-binding protein [Candidatus Saccharibacteria bacterium]|nr:ABC transporter ATP-binding protein [Candidatus Saccharibacteria bacterium]MCL1962705.1 ABC transporter ATP-binding protein [Candidatus Saccharibacteria bacterium]